MLLSLQEDASVLTHVLASMVLWQPGEADNISGFGSTLVDLGDFIRNHNWPDPIAARWLADNLEDIFAALNRNETKAEREARRA